MTIEMFPPQIKYSSQFKKSLKRLRKKYRSITEDVQGFIDSIVTDDFPGNLLQGIESEAKVYKARVKNSDNNKGKSGGYRVIYAYVNSQYIFLVDIYSKSEQPDMTTAEINNIVSAYQFNLEEE